MFSKLIILQSAKEVLNEMYNGVTTVFLSLFADTTKQVSVTDLIQK